MSSSLPEKIALGWDFSTQQIKVIGIGIESGNVLLEEHIKFDDDLPKYETKGGVHVHCDGVTVTSPAEMWVEGLDLILQRLHARDFDFKRVDLIGGAAQQHGSVYWKSNSRKTLQNLDPSKSLHSQLSSSFSLPNSPIWMDASTEKQCREIEEFAGGAVALAQQTGSRAFHRYTAAQIRKLHQQQPTIYSATQCISLVSSFAASLFLGDYAPMAEADASGTNLMDIRRRCWLPQLAEFTAPNLLEKLGELVGDRSLIGSISPYFAQRYNFQPDCRICAFTGDNPATLAALRLPPGAVAISLGSSTCAFFSCCDLPSRDEASLDCVAMASSVSRGQFMPMLVLKNGALVRERLRNSLCSGSWQQFDQLLDSTPAGNEGIFGLCLDVPEIAPQGAVGEFSATSDDPSPTPAPERSLSPAQRLRSAVEGHAMSLRHFAASMGLGDGDGDGCLVATGGASGNVRLLQLLANVFNRRVLATAVANSAALGAALLAVSARQPELEFRLALPPPPPEPVPVAEPQAEAVLRYGQLREVFAEFILRLRQRFD